MKTHLTKRLVALFLTLAMVFSLAPMTFAEEPAADEYVLAAEVKDGDKVVIVNPAAGMALSNADLSEAQPSYRAGVAVTPEEGKLTNPETAIVWTVEETEGGVRLLDADGRKLSMASKGLELDKENDVWEIRSLGENNVALVNVNAAPGSSGDPKALEWYNKYSEFSTHYLNTGDSQFIHQLSQIDLNAVFQRSNYHMTLVIDTKVRSSPPFNIVEFFRIFNTPFSHFSVISLIRL